MSPTLPLGLFHQHDLRRNQVSQRNSDDFEIDLSVLTKRPKTNGDT